MDMKKMLAALDGVESAEGTASGVAQKGSMKSLLESLDSVAAEEVVAEETEEVVEATDEEMEAMGWEKSPTNENAFNQAAASEGTFVGINTKTGDFEFGLSHEEVTSGRFTHMLPDDETYFDPDTAEELVGAPDEEMEAMGWEKLPTNENAFNQVDEAIMVSAEGDEAAELLAILQNAGMAPPQLPAMPEPEMEDTEYANSPDEETFGMDAVIASGDDLNKSKEAYADVDGGDNPMETFEGKFKSMLDEMLAEDDETTDEVEELEEAQSPAQKAAFEKMLAAKKGSKDEDEDEDEKVDESSEEVEEAADMGLSRFLKMAGI